MKKWKKGVLALALAGVTVFTTACGGSKGASGKDSETKQEAKEWVYVPEFLELEEDNADYYNMKFVGDSLYYQSWRFDEMTGEGSQSICRYSLADGSVEEVNIPVLPSEYGEDGSSSGQNMSSFNVLEDGSFVVLFDNYKNDAAGNYQSWMQLAKFDAAGNEIFNKDLKEVIGDDEENQYVRNILVDGQGRIYLPADSKIWLFDAEGNSCGAVDMSTGGNSWINSSGIGRDGKAYVSFYSYDENSSSYSLSEIDFDKRAMGASYANFPGASGETISAGVEKDFIVQDGTSVYEYDMATQTAEKLFDWLDSDINGNYVQNIGVLEDGRILAVSQDWNSGENSLALLKKTPGSEVVQKEQIVIGTLNGGYDLQGYAVKFNRSSDKYHVSIRQYIDFNNLGETSFEDGIASMNNDLTSANCPDIMDLTGLNISQLASKGLFEDLTPYLEKSTEVKKEDYLENILDAYTIDGKLICLPGSFEMQTVIGRAGDVGTEMGWTLAELMAYADQNPGAAIFDGATQAEIMQYLFMYNEDSFIDWEKAECSFDTDRKSVV